jgi:hypothetical protein
MTPWNVGENFSTHATPRECRSAVVRSRPKVRLEGPKHSRVYRWPSAMRESRYSALAARSRRCVFNDESEHAVDQEQHNSHTRSHEYSERAAATTVIPHQNISRRLTPRFSCRLHALSFGRAARTRCAFAPQKEDRTSGSPAFDFAQQLSACG